MKREHKTPSRGAMSRFEHSRPAGPQPAAILAMLFAAIFTFVVGKGQRVAHRLQRDIDELRAR